MESKHGNLADPDYEPTDEELQQLARDAFSEVPQRNAEALSRIHEEIARLSREMLQKFSPAEALKCS